MAPIIRAENLGKKYQLGPGKSGNYIALRDVIACKFRSYFKRSDPSSNSQNGTEFWALRDINLEINEGEVVGIVGRNGAGKSTLLKVLSRITTPSTGRITLRGKVSSLLEVGTGFHPELTGRENIYLNGAILGMRRAEITRKFDEIVDFAEISRFLDTPVKRFSSGMYVRLAFAVAAHLEPDVLIVDEVLAVGDADFQKKCLGKMEDVGRSGRTVLFVSHSMHAVVRLCTRAVLMSEGQVAYSGSVTEATRRYLNSGNEHSAERIWNAVIAPQDSVAQLLSARVLNHAGNCVPTLSIHEPITIEVQYLQLQDKTSSPLTVSIHLLDQQGNRIFVSNDFFNEEWYVTPRRRGRVISSCTIPSNFLATGDYSVLVAVCSYSPDNIHAIENNAIAFNLTEDPAKSGNRTLYGGDWPGLTRPQLSWTSQITF